jgi:hypothetical protein
LVVYWDRWAEINDFWIVLLVHHDVWRFYISVTYVRVGDKLESLKDFQYYLQSGGKWLHFGWVDCFEKRFLIFLNVKLIPGIIQREKVVRDVQTDLVPHKLQEACLISQSFFWDLVHGLFLHETALPFFNHILFLKLDLSGLFEQLIFGYFFVLDKRLENSKTVLSKVNLRICIYLWLFLWFYHWYDLELVSNSVDFGQNWGSSLCTDLFQQFLSLYFLGCIF